MGKRNVRWVIAASLVCLAASCGGEEGSSFVPPDGVFTGALYTGVLEGSDAMTAFAVNGDNVVGYVCGGETTLATHSRWFCGRADETDAGLHIVVEEAAWTLDAIIGDDAVRGTLRSPDAAVTPVNAALAGGGAGLFADEVGGCSTGVIVVPGDAEPHVQGTYCAGDFDYFEQVTPVRPLETEQNQLDVIIAGEGPAMTVFRVQP